MAINVWQSKYGNQSIYGNQCMANMRGCDSIYGKQMTHHPSGVPSKLPIPSTCEEDHHEETHHQHQYELMTIDQHQKSIKRVMNMIDMERPGREGWT